MPGDVRSKKQAGLFGLIASGRKPRKKSLRRSTSSLTRASARRALRGSKVRKLPARAKRKTRKRKR